MKFKVMFNFLLYQMYSDRRGNGQKPPRTKPSRQNPPDKRPHEQLRKNLYRRLLARFFYTRPTKNLGGVRDVWRIFEGPGLCDKVWQGRGVKIGQKYRDVLYGRPQNLRLLM